MKKLLFPLLLWPFLAFAADVSSPEVWSDNPADPNSAVNAARLTDAFNGITILPTFISAKPSATPVPTDALVYFQTGSTSLKQCTLAQLAAATSLTSVGLGMPTNVFSVTGSPLTSNGNIVVAFKPVPPKWFLAGPATGTNAVPTFRPPASGDNAIAAVIPAAATIDWSAGNVFTKTVVADTAFSFTNVRDGQTIIVCIKQGGSGGNAVGFFGVVWSGGVAPVATATAGKSDIFTFIRAGVIIYGTVQKNF